MQVGVVAGAIVTVERRFLLVPGAFKRFTIAFEKRILAFALFVVACATLGCGIIAGNGMIFGHDATQLNKIGVHHR